MTELLSGQILHTFGIAVVDAVLLSWLTLAWYRRSVLRLMTQRVPGGARPADLDKPLEEPRLAATHARGPASLSFAMFDSGVAPPSTRHGDPAVRAVRVRLILAYAFGAAAWSAVMIAAQLIGAEPPVRAVAWLAAGWTNAWLLVPSLALLLAWDRTRTVKVGVAYVVAGMGAVALFTFMGQLLTGLFNTAPLTNPPLLVAHLAATAWLPALILLPAALRRVRAVMPVALAGVLVFGVTSLAFREVLLAAFDQPAFRSILLEAAALTSVSITYYGMFMLAAIPVGWICWLLVRALATGFERKWFSDPQIIVDCWWIILTAVQTSELTVDYGVLGLPIGVGAFVAYRGTVAFLLRIRPRSSAPSAERVTLLRVFGYQARTEALFDQVASRWRFRGPVQLIAGTDLALRTTDPGDLLTFLQGQLASRYVRSEADVPGVMARLDDERDPDGRFRVNEIYCHDHTWREALAALLDRSDTVLADLRGFTERNAGCRFELEQLLGRVDAGRVTIVHDGTTDLGLLVRVLAEAWATLEAEGRLAVPAPVALVRIERQTSAAVSTILECLRGERRADRVVTAASLQAPAAGVAVTAAP
jgi:hypothetical protein